MSPFNLSVEALTPNVLVFRDGAFRKVIRVRDPRPMELVSL